MYLNLVGVNTIGSSFRRPDSANPPMFLSYLAAQQWKSWLSDPESFYSLTVTALSPVTAWEFMINSIYEWSIKNQIPYLTSKVSSSVVANNLSLRIQTQRSMLVRHIDNTHVLETCKFVNVQRMVQKNADGMMYLRMEAECSRSMNMVDFNFRIAKSLFRSRARNWKYSGFMSGATAEFMHMGTKFYYVTHLNIETDFIPPTLAHPVPDLDDFERYIMKRFWMPAIRKFGYRTAPKNLLL